MRYAHLRSSRGHKMTYLDTLPQKIVGLGSVVLIEIGNRNRKNNRLSIF